MSCACTSSLLPFDGPPRILLCHCLSIGEYHVIENDDVCCVEASSEHSQTACGVCGKFRLVTGATAIVKLKPGKEGFLNIWPSGKTVIQVHHGRAISQQVPYGFSYVATRPSDVVISGYTLPRDEVKYPSSLFVPKRQIASGLCCNRLKWWVDRYSTDLLGEMMYCLDELQVPPVLASIVKEYFDCGKSHYKAFLSDDHSYL